MGELFDKTNSELTVYIASPGFSNEEQELLRKYEAALQAVHYRIFSPFLHSKGDMKTEEGRYEVFESNRKAIDNAHFVVANLDWTNINGKYSVPIPDQGTNWEIGYASGIRKCMGAPYVIAVTSESTWGINIMLRYGVDGFIAGVDRFFKALQEHGDLDIFVGLYDNPQAKKFVLY